MNQRGPGGLTSNPRIPYQLSTQRPFPAGPDGASLLCHIVVNVEHWTFDAGAPRSILPAPHGRQPAPDVPNFSWAEYGMRCGLPRILDALASRGLPASTSCNGQAVHAYPAAVESMIDAGWEFIAHGLRQQALPDVDDELATIRETLDLLEGATGARPRGWLGPGLQETLETPDHLAAAGVEYVCDWTVDDLPVDMATTSGRLVALPYTLELNDSVVFAVERHPAQELLERLQATVEVFDRDAAPRVLTLALHPHLLGVPHRISVLERMLDTLIDHPSAVFLRGGEILDWYTGEVDDLNA